MGQYASDGLNQVFAQNKFCEAFEFDERLQVGEFVSPEVKCLHSFRTGKPIQDNKVCKLLRSKLDRGVWLAVFDCYVLFHVLKVHLSLDGWQIFRNVHHQNLLTSPVDDADYAVKSFSFQALFKIVAGLVVKRQLRKKPDVSDKVDPGLLWQHNAVPTFVGQVHCQLPFI